MNTEHSFSLKYSVKILPEETVKSNLQEIGGNLTYSETNKILISIKYCKLNVLNDLKYIIPEICDCLIIRANQAAITLTNHLFENMLKRALMTWDSRGKQVCSDDNLNEAFKQEVDNYDNKDIEPNINKCRSKGLLSKEETKRLVYLKNRYRNPFSHASYSQLFKDTSTTIYKGSYNNPSEIKEETIDISNVPMYQLIAQKQFADFNAFGYFIEIYSYIDKLDRKLLDLYPDLLKFLKDRSLID